VQLLTGRKRLEAHPDAGRSGEASGGTISSTERRGLLAAVWGGCLLFLCGVTIADPDLWGHTLYGLRAIEQGVLVESSDPFSYTAAGAAWVNHEWLSERLFAECWRRGGNAGMTALRNAFVVALFVVSWPTLRTRCSLPAAWILLVFTTECLANYVVFLRPQLATFVGVLATLSILRRQWERLSGALWLVPGGMVLWANLHGGFLAGVAFVWLFAVAAVARSSLIPRRFGEAWKWLAAATATALATLINPYGLQLHRMLWNHLVTPQLVLEWQPVWAAAPSAIYVVPFLLAGFAFGLSRRWERIDVLVLAAAAWQAASHIRHVALFSLAVLALLAVPLSDAVSRLFPQLHASWSLPGRRWWRWTAAVLILVFLAVVHVRGVREIWNCGLRPWDIAVEARAGVPGMPVAAVAEMRRRGLQGNLLTDYGWGQFILWHLWPDVRVAIDGRYRTVYPAEIEEALIALQTAASSDAERTPLLDDFPTDLVLAPVGGSLESYLKRRSGWTETYRDEQAVVYVPRQPGLAQSLGDRPAAAATPPKWVRFPGLDVPR